MWSFFSRDAAKDFGYEIGPEVIEHLDTSIWKLHSGKKKSNGDIVSVFTFEATSRETQALLDIVKSSVKRLKTLRHPSIVTYVDSLETDKLVYLVTEKVEPLSCHINKSSYSESQRKLAIAWGLYQIASGLGFLNKDCNLSHNNVCMGSVFVDRAGEWKLFGLEHVVQCQERPPAKVIPHLTKYNPPELDSSSKVKVHNWSYDSWGLGCLIWEAFNGFLMKKSALKTIDKIPQNLSLCYNELINDNPIARPSTFTFLKKATRPKGFFKNRFVETMLFLREIHIKETEEKVAFFNNLSSVLDSFPQDICLYKVLPELINAFEFGNAGSSVLTPMFKLGKHLSDEEYQQKIVPSVVKMFSSKDRSTRVKLLQQMEEFIHHFTPSIINSQIFPSISQGFLDTSPVIREYTIKCILFLAPKLNYQNLNEEVLKHLARLQTKDEQGGIRTNTTVCLGKIATYLHPQTRKKVLISGFLRALRDPFPPARTAAILAFSATQNYYSINDCATRVLPALCHFTVDPEKSVRDQAFKVIGGFLQKLQKLSEDPSLAEEMEKEMQSMTPSEVAASWTSWAVTSLVDKLHMPALSRSSSASTANVTSSSSSNTDSKVMAKVQESKSMENIEVHLEEDKSLSLTAAETPTDLEGWDTEWNDEEELADAIGITTITKGYVTEMVKEETVSDWVTDDWSSFLKAENVEESDKKISSYFSKENLEDPFSSISVEPKKSTLNLTKSHDGWDAETDQWEDWGETATASKSPERQQRQNEERLAREEKRKQRLNDRHLARQMKLAQKIS